MKKLYICKSPFQVIVAIFLQTSDFCLTNSDILIVKQFGGVEELVEKLKSVRLFHKVYVADCGYEKNRVIFSIAVMFPRILLRLARIEIETDYDKIFSANLYGDIDNAIYSLQERAEPCMYDIGYETYTNDFLHADYSFSKMHLLIRTVSKIILGREYIDKASKELFLFDPDLQIMKMPFNIHKIHVNENSLNIISNIFCVEDVLSEYNTKYIFFEECFASDFNNNGDMPIIDMLHSLLGEKIMIKLHPRDKTNRFIQRDIHTNKSFGVPTEAIVQGLASEKKIFITFSSGSVINYKFFTNSSIKSIFLYKLMPHGFVDMPEDRKKWFNKFERKYGDDIFVPNSMEELKKILIRLEEIG